MVDDDGEELVRGDEQTLTVHDWYFRRAMMVVHELEAIRLFKILAELTDREIFLPLESTTVSGVLDIRGALVRRNGNAPGLFQYQTWEAAHKGLEAQLANLNQNERAHLLATIARAETDIALSRARLDKLEKLAADEGSAP